MDVAGSVCFSVCVFCDFAGGLCVFGCVLGFGGGKRRMGGYLAVSFGVNMGESSGIVVIVVGHDRRGGVFVPEESGFSHSFSTSGPSVSCPAGVFDGNVSFVYRIPLCPLHGGAGFGFESPAA